MEIHCDKLHLNPPVMKLEHIAIWTKDLEKLKIYYTRYFEGKANSLYTNSITGFTSYFITFDGGARLELMHKSNIPENLNDRETQQHLGIIHLALAVNTRDEVDMKAEELKKAGYSILRGPRTTGDGYYEFETLDPDGNRIEVIFRI
jgi:lactoylglutathione lyase